jgi:hypothetical protein
MEGNVLYSNMKTEHDFIHVLVYVDCIISKFSDGNFSTSLVWPKGQRTHTYMMTTSKNAQQRSSIHIQKDAVKGSWYRYRRIGIRSCYSGYFIAARRPRVAVADLMLGASTFTLGGRRQMMQSRYGRKLLWWTTKFGCQLCWNRSSEDYPEKEFPREYFVIRYPTFQRRFKSTQLDHFI